MSHDDDDDNNRDGVITAKAYARVGILGNPSDGYEGKCISSTIENYAATATIRGADSSVQFGSHMQFPSLQAFREHITQNGYPQEDGATLLLMATTKMFLQAMDDHHYVILKHARRSFALSFTTTVPRQVGLAGSSAICTAVFRALLAWFQVSRLPPATLAQYVYLVEAQELGIACGLQDRVAQAFEQLVMMDFKHNNSAYVCPDLPLLLHESVAWFLLFPTTTDIEKTSGGVHLPVKQRWLDGDPLVRRTMQAIADLVPAGVHAASIGDWDAFCACMNRNFALRCEIFNVHKEDQRLVKLAQSFDGCGVGAKLPGSGGCVLVFLASQQEQDRFVKYVQQHQARAEPVRLTRQ